jgi:hypothetical protein
MAVRIAGTGRSDRDPGTHRLDERLGRSGPTAVVGDLQEVDLRQALRQELRIDVLLDVAGQEEASVADRPEEDDRDVVDASAGIGRRRRYLPADRP